jgi:hypothetical protein
VLFNWRIRSKFTQINVECCIDDDQYLHPIIESSCIYFHRNYRWRGYPRSVDQDIEGAHSHSRRVDVIRHTAKVRSFLLLASDPARIPWEQSAEPTLAQELATTDLAGLEERRLTRHPNFLPVFFGGYLKHSGDFHSATRLFKLMTKRGLAAEGYLGQADVLHLLANWRNELAEYKARGVFPAEIEIPKGYEADPIPNLDRYTLEAAIELYEKAAASAGARVSFYRLRIPTQSGRGFRFDVGRRSDLMSATIPK